MTLNIDCHSQRILVLTGPAGTGKTATLRALSREMDFDILEWRNSSDERFDSKSACSLFGPGCAYKSPQANSAQNMKASRTNSINSSPVLRLARPCRLARSVLFHFLKVRAVTYTADERSCLSQVWFLWDSKRTVVAVTTVAWLGSYLVTLAVVGISIHQLLRECARSVGGDKNSSA